jgi:hypothetical protein
MRKIVLVVVGLAAACDTYGPDFDNAVVYPGPCSSRLDAADGGHSVYTYEYENGVLTTVRSEGRGGAGFSTRSETTWRRNADGSLAEIFETRELDGDPLSPMVWAFDETRVVVTFLDATWSVYDRGTFEFLPFVGSQAIHPLAELGLVEHKGVPYTWSTEGALLVRTSADERATYELDALGRILVIQRDVENDGSVDIVLRHAFEGERLVRKTSENANNPWSIDWRYDAAGNVATAEHEAGAYPATFEEYDYGCW